MNHLPTHVAPTVVPALLEIYGFARKGEGWVYESNHRCLVVQLKQNPFSYRVKYVDKQQGISDVMWFDLTGSVREAQEQYRLLLGFVSHYLTTAPPTDSRSSQAQGSN